MIPSHEIRFANELRTLVQYDTSEARCHAALPNGVTMLAAALVVAGCGDPKETPCAGQREIILFAAEQRDLLGATASGSCKVGTVVSGTNQIHGELTGDAGSSCSLHIEFQPRGAARTSCDVTFTRASTCEDIWVDVEQTADGAAACRVLPRRYG